MLSDTYRMRLGIAVYLMDLVAKMANVNFARCAGLTFFGLDDILYAVTYNS